MGNFKPKPYLYMNQLAIAKSKILNVNCKRKIHLKQFKNKQTNKTKQKNEIPST